MCAIYIELGVIFFLFSLLYLIWINLGEKNPHDNSPSAYSVFNKGVKKIDGNISYNYLKAVKLTFRSHLGTFEGGAAIENMLFQNNGQYVA